MQDNIQISNLLGPTFANKVFANHIHVNEDKTSEEGGLHYQKHLKYVGVQNILAFIL